MLYYIIRAILVPFVYLLFWPKIQGKENLPTEGSAIIFSNHTSLFDPIVLGCLLPRRIYFMAKQELFRIKPFALFMKGLGAFPVKRGTADISAVKTALYTLRKGEVFGIFPEGTRSRDGNMQQFTHGTAAIALKSRAITVPVVITGGYRLFRPIQVIVGKPLDLEKYYGNKSNSELLDKVSEEMMEAVKSLVPFQ